jgi:hypothetical protein
VKIDQEENDTQIAPEYRSYYMYICFKTFSFPQPRRIHEKLEEQPNQPKDKATQCQQVPQLRLQQIGCCINTANTHQQNNQSNEKSMHVHDLPA